MVQVHGGASFSTPAALCFLPSFPVSPQSHRRIPVVLHLAVRLSPLSARRPRLLFPPLPPRLDSPRRFVWDDGLGRGLPGPARVISLPRAETPLAPHRTAPSARTPSRLLSSSPWIDSLLGFAPLPAGWGGYQEFDLRSHVFARR
jgi:hypothetical protein